MLPVIGPNKLNVNPIFEIGPMEPRFSEWLVFEGISVDEKGVIHPPPPPPPAPPPPPPPRPIPAAGRSDAAPCDRPPMFELRTRHRRHQRRPPAGIALHPNDPPLAPFRDYQIPTRGRAIGIAIGFDREGRAPHHRRRRGHRRSVARR